MNVTQKTLALSTLLLSAANSAYSQTSATLQFVANSSAEYRQLSSGTVFDGGRFSMECFDGNFVYGCSSVANFDPDPLVCPLGATGFIDRGLFDNSVVRYFEISSLVGARVIEPFNPQAIRLIAAPVSGLPRPLVGFTDQGVNVFYNIRSNFVRDYPISEYSFNREYLATERTKFDKEVVPGKYVYNFPTLRNPTFPNIIPPPTVISINQFPMLDGFRLINKQPVGLQFTNIKWVDGFAEFDPTVITRINWKGNDRTVISPNADNLFLSIVPTVDELDPSSAPSGGAAIFPRFTGGAGRVLLTSALSQEFILPPDFIQAGRTGLLQLDFVINRPTTGSIGESATRSFRLPIKFKNPLLGFVRNYLPSSATSQQLASNFDYDKDGADNFTEWVFGSNPAVATSMPAMPSVTTTTTTAPSLSTKSISSLSETPTSQALEYKVNKLSNPDPILKYEIQHSIDMINWTTITVNHPDWALSDTQKEIKVTEKTSGNKTGGFFRTMVVPLVPPTNK